jgi:hypothetical protein
MIGNCGGIVLMGKESETVEAKTGSKLYGERWIWMKNRFFLPIPYLRRGSGHSEIYP